MNTTSPTVSVAMIAYNKADVIDQAIKGVITQKTGFDIELIIVDDNSTDTTYETASRWAARYPSAIKLYRNPVNLGLQRNYVEAFSHCSGKYLAICDADDYWFNKRKLATQVRYMETHPECAVTFHRVVNYYESDGSKSLSNGNQATETTIADLSRSNYITNLSVMYRKDLVDLGNLPAWIFDDRSPDYAMHMLYAAHGTIHYFRRPMGVYRIAPGSSWSMTQKYERLRMSLTVRENLMTTFASLPEVMQGLRDSTVNILLHMLINADDPSKKEYVLRKLSTYPPYNNPEAVTQAISRIRNSRPPLKNRILTPLRKLISHLIPLPKA